MSFKYKGAEISAREMTIGDEETIGVIARKLAATGANPNARYSFAEFAVGSNVYLETQKGDEVAELPVPIIDENSTVEEAEAAFMEWRKLPRAFFAKWKVALDEANSETGGNFT